MPDWLIPLAQTLATAAVGGGVFAGLAALIKARADARLSTETQQDEQTLKLINSLGASEEVFRKAVLGAYQEEVKARLDIDARLTVTQNQLTVVTLERDDLKRKWERAQTDLDEAHKKIRHLEDEIAALQARP